MKEPIHYIGMSVTREVIEYHVSGQSYFALNQPDGHARLIVQLSQIPGSLLVICELSGGAENRIVEALHANGFPVALASVADVCAQTGMHGVAEIDGAALAKYGAVADALLSRPTATLAPRVLGQRLVAPAAKSKAPCRAPTRGGLWKRLSAALRRWAKTKTRRAGVVLILPGQ